MASCGRASVLAAVLFIFLSLCILPSHASGQIIIDHSSVDLYDDIPEPYFSEAKKMWMNIPGESHSSGYRKGVALLSQQEPAYAAVVTESGNPEPYREDALRVSRAVRNQYNSWTYGTGEDAWYASTALRAGLKSHINYSNTHGIEIAAAGFGWCWDMTWHNSPGGGVDPVYQVRWAGSSVGGPEGDLRWGLDAEDQALTGNSVSMDTYLSATKEYDDFARANGFRTRVIFTTGPVDGYSGESGYQRQLKHEHIRSFVRSNSSLVLFDYADILSFNDAGAQNLQIWNGHSYQMIHADNMLDLNGSYAEDGDHIGQRGAVRLGKALWVLAARLAGWNPGLGAPDTQPPSITITSHQNGSIVNGTVSIEASASDDAGVAGVQFMLDGSALGAEDAQAPYSVAWNTSGEVSGSHTISAVARDAAGNTNTSSIALAVSNPAGGQADRVFFVRAGASGRNDGSDWANAWTDLPATFVRNATYYVAAGSYGPHAFNTAMSGTLPVTLKKATESDHGTDAGWSSAYASGQAEFSAAATIFTISTSYWTIDGVTGSGKDGAGYGFRLKSNSTSGPVYGLVRTTGTTDGIILRHIELDGNGVDLPDARDGIYATNNPGNLQASDLFIHDFSRMMMTVTRATGLLVERSVFLRNHNTAGIHSQAVQLTSSVNSTFRHNWFENIVNTGVIITIMSYYPDVNQNLYVYGNVFINTDPYYNTGRLMGDANNCSTRGVRFYQNTIVGMRTGGNSGSLIFDGAYSEDNLAYNNIYYNSNVGFTGAAHDYNTLVNSSYAYGSSQAANEQVISSDSFADLAGGDFHLIAATAAGIALPSPYGTDPDGLARGADGAWDRGAYEFASPHHRSDADQDGCIRMAELVSFLERWEISNADVSLREVIEAIGLWKGGCA